MFSTFALRMQHPPTTAALIIAMIVSLTIADTVSATPADTPNLSPSVIPHHFVLGSVAYSAPLGRFAEKLQLPPTVSWSLGYLYAPNHTLLFGASGHWMHTSGPAYDLIDPGIDYPDRSITILQMMAMVRLRMFKHEFTPYADLEAGMCYLTSPDQVRPCLAAAIGVQIPVSRRVDIDVRIRTSWAPFTNDELTIASFHLGFVFALPR